MPKFFTVVAVFGLSLFSLLSLTACPGPKKPEPGARIVRVKGDPATFVANTQANGNHPLPLDLFTKKGRWDLAAYILKEEPAEVSYEKVVQNQVPKGESGVDELDKRYGQAMADVQITDLVTITMGKGKDQVQFYFAIDGKQVTLASLSVGGHKLVLGEPYHVIHTSATPDLAAFSLLLYDSSPKKRMLTALYFTRNLSSHSNINFTSDPYNYMFGRGTKIGWPRKEPLAIKTCNTAPKALEDLVQKSVDPWQQALQKRMTIEVKNQERCPPFSDLNTHAVYFVNSWIELAGPDQAVVGNTPVTANLDKGTLLDSDIFILLGEFQESLDKDRSGQIITDAAILSQPPINEAFLGTLLHEMGHLLGLHHQFDSSIPSVMSYEDVPPVLTTYDQMAIQALYE